MRIVNKIDRFFLRICYRIGARIPWLVYVVCATFFCTALWISWRLYTNFDGSILFVSLGIIAVFGYLSKIVLDGYPHRRPLRIHLHQMRLSEMRNSFIFLILSFIITHFSMTDGILVFVLWFLYCSFIYLASYRKLS